MLHWSTYVKSIFVFKILHCTNGHLRNGVLRKLKQSEGLVGIVNGLCVFLLADRPHYEAPSVATTNNAGSITEMLMVYARSPKYPMLIWAVAL
jgi:hypothetical protein